VISSRCPSIAAVLAYDEQAHPVAVVWTVFRKCKGAKDTRHLIFGYTDPGVTDFDANTIAGSLRECDLLGLCISPRC
jgi:hypothetical protein